MERGNSAALIGGIGLEIVAAVIFVKWQNPPQWIVFSLLSIGGLMMLYALGPALLAAGRAAGRLRIILATPSAVSGSVAKEGSVKSAPVRTKRYPTSVNVGGLRWVDTESSYAGTGEPILRAECSQHKVPVVWRGNVDGVRDLHDDDAVGPDRGSVWCQARGGHWLQFDEDARIGDLEKLASTLVSAERNKRR